MLYRDGVLFTTVHSTNVTCLKLHHHQVLVSKNVNLTQSVRHAVTMKHGKAAVITEGSKAGRVLNLKVMWTINTEEKENGSKR